MKRLRFRTVFENGPIFSKQASLFKSFVILGVQPDKLALGDFHIIKVNSTAFLPRHEELKRIIISFQH